jgi:hypothetical protein
MAAYEAGGKTFVVMANEGDFREDDADRSAASNFGGAGSLANLRVSNPDSSTGDLYAAGARSCQRPWRSGCARYACKGMRGLKFGA